MSELHLTTTELATGLPEIEASPKDQGTLKQILGRPEIGGRNLFESCEVTIDQGIPGDNWKDRYRAKGMDPDPNGQITVMNYRAAQLITRTKERLPLPGDNLLVDLDLSDENLQAGQRLAIGSAVFEVTPKPHNGCKKFTERFGMDAIKFISTPERKNLHLRGIYIKVIEPGVISAGDTITKLV